MKKRIITIGEILMRLTTSGQERFSQANHYGVHFGGTEANVAISLAHFDQQVSHVTVLPDHEIGYTAAKYLKANNIDTSNILFSDIGRMGLYFLERGAMQRASKIIYDRSHSAFSHISAQDVHWDQLFEDACWLHWTGITPAVSAAAAHTCKIAIEKAKAYGLTVSSDINYRRNLWQYGKNPLEVMPELIAHTDIIIAGLPDFKNCMDIKASSFEVACLEAQKKFPNIRYIATTLREVYSASHNTLSAVMWTNDKLYQSKTYKMSPIIDRIGGGDAFMAGLIYGILFKGDQEALEFATAASVWKHSIPGDANLATIREVEQLMEGLNIGRLLR